MAGVRGAKRCGALSFLKKKNISVSYKTFPSEKYFDWEEAIVAFMKVVTTEGLNKMQAWHEMLPKIPFIPFDILDRILEAKESRLEWGVVFFRPFLQETRLMSRYYPVTFDVFEFKTIYQLEVATWKVYVFDLSQKVYRKGKPKTGRKNSKRCGRCTGCLSPRCGLCKYCRMSHLHRVCYSRRCDDIVYPKSPTRQREEQEEELNNLV